ncbi:MAG: hypothetical protein IPP90_09650 [Gemmatimonadaceae bacterium]|nr:hypothetical protein [Gemmatimonadaceae bacterium]
MNDFTMSPIDAAPVLTISARALRPVLPGLLLAVLTLLLGFMLGVVFGLNEDLIKSRLSASAAAADTAVYHQDPAAMKAVTDKSWTYMQRSHLHAGSLGTVAIALTLVVMLLGTGARLAAAISVALGIGALGYSLYWVWAGFRAPALGGTGAAKESLAWLAIPSSGLVVAATFVVAVLLLNALRTPRTA